MNFQYLDHFGTKKQKQFSGFKARIAYLLDKYQPQNFQQHAAYFPKQTFLDDYY